MDQLPKMQKMVAAERNGKTYGEDAEAEDEKAEDSGAGQNGAGDADGDTEGNQTSLDGDGSTQDGTESAEDTPQIRKR